MTGFQAAHLFLLPMFWHMTAGYCEISRFLNEFAGIWLALQLGASFPPLQPVKPWLYPSFRVLTRATARLIVTGSEWFENTHSCWAEG